MKKQRKRGLPAYPGSRRAHLLLALLIILEAGSILAQAYFLAKSVTALFSRTPLPDVLSGIGIFFAAFMIRHTIGHIETALAERFARQAAGSLREKILKVYFQPNISSIRRHGTGHLVTLAMEGIDKVKDYLGIIGIRTIKTMIVPATVVVFVFFFDPISSMILVVTVPIVVIFMILLGLAAQKMADRQYATYTRLANYFLDSLKGLETLSYLGRSKQHASNIERVSDDYRNATMRTLKVAFLSSFALDFFTSLSIAFVAVGLGLRLIDGAIGLLPALTILILAPEYFSPIKQVGKDYHATLDGQIAMAEVDKLIEDEETRGQKAGNIEGFRGIPAVALKHIDIEVDGAKLLDDISFKATTGLNAIVGPSGAGKSTLLQLLAGRLSPSSGEIYGNGKLTNTLNDPEWISKIAYIPQHPYVFPLSLADNIRFYEPEATDEQVEKLISNIGLGKFVASLPNGIHERIGEGGRTLSGGQAQRVALARALLSEKPVILLDEPTAHLDIETEYEIKQLVLSLAKNKVIFLATHRLHWLNSADQILLLEKGHVTANGTHMNLMQDNKAYQDFIEWGRGAHNA
ncbi:thiol reductant ABC exporter subunit CydD [Aciduricibacillus chroicocephali]|uniref:Thiol reductant ABC exporter subunit CydD n=1 Tax=Aciduricibacillus chroicocephali TaxID=3054939 RepID=A0ABY9KVI3_9BACI|nr:thiol reductant ABC exporter subunit CydD [Bacillaceae bacterium 44XB]